MLRRLLALTLGPIGLIIMGFMWAGSGGIVIALFLVVGAVVFVPIFGVATSIFGSSLLMSLAIANAFPVCFYFFSCAGHACPNYTMWAAAPQYFCATFCAVVYWLVMKESWRRKIPDEPAIPGH